jgi:hypothetical protein
VEILIIIISSLILLGFTRFGVRAVRTADGRFRLILRAGFLRFNLLKLLEKKDTKDVLEPLVGVLKKKQKKEKLFTAETALRAARPVIRSLLKGIRVDKLILRLDIAGSDDPFDAALLHGGVWAAWGMVRPVITRNLRVKKERVDIKLDFKLEKTNWEADVAFTISLGRSLAVAFSAARAILKPNKRKGEIYG